MKETKKGKTGNVLMQVRVRWNNVWIMEGQKNWAMLYVQNEREKKVVKLHWKRGSWRYWPTKGTVMLACHDFCSKKLIEKTSK